MLERGRGLMLEREGWMLERVDVGEGGGCWREGVDVGERGG